MLQTTVRGSKQLYYVAKSYECIEMDIYILLLNTKYLFYDFKNL